MFRSEKLFNDSWEFQLVREGESYSEDRFIPVELPHDWLIYDCDNLYEDGTGYYRKSFKLDKKTEKRYFINFDGVYMDSTIYVNSLEVGVNRYGYSPFEFDITDSLIDGENEIKVEIRHKSPNSRWYSGAGIFRDITFIETNDVHIAGNGVYISSELISDEKSCLENEGNNKSRGKWKVVCDIEVEGLEKVLLEKSDITDRISFDFKLEHKSVSRRAGKCICRNVDFMDIPKNYYSNEDSDKVIFSQGTSYTIKNEDESPKAQKSTVVFRTDLIIGNGRIWDITSPERYELEAVLKYDGEMIDEYKTCFGLRTIEYTVDEGFFLNGRHVKINGVCEHHDLGLFGAAFNKDAMQRKFVFLKKMGVNAVRTSHNMPSKIFMDLADEMGIMVDSEGFDMWMRPKTEYDYARFFKENYKDDIRKWVRRDRNHPSVIMWSIGNEIYDCHADESAPELARSMKETVEAYDYLKNAPVTHASNFMAWEGARKCTDVLKMAGYNYGERLYDEQHIEHPDWKIYGSETCSTVQSRGIYHFPLEVSVLADDDEQCSSLGNCTTSWGAPSTEYVITMDRDRKYSQGQFLWTGFDYIGEPTPYHTKNSYFGQIDTAGFPKDTFYLFKGSWTDPEKDPFVHIFPYWDFNDGQLIDVRVASNCDRVELLFRSEGKEAFDPVGYADIDHKNGNIIAPAWKLPYGKGILRAIAYIDGIEKARTEVKSFSDAVALTIKENYFGEDELFFEINAVDADGNTVENACSRIKVTVEGAGELSGLDNGDSTDNDDYKCDSRRMFSGKLLAAVSIKGKTGWLKVTACSPMLKSAIFTAFIDLPSSETADSVEKNDKCCAYRNDDNDQKLINQTESSGNICKEIKGSENIGIKKRIYSGINDFNREEIPVRNAKLVVTDGDQYSRVFDAEHKVINVKAELCPLNATYSDIKWAAVNEKAVPTNIVDLEPYENEEGHFCRLTAKGDGEFRLRALIYNGERVAKVISVLEFKITGLGKAFINPYEFVYGSLYTDAKGEIGNGNDKGIATPRGGDSYFGFENVDFGELGSDEISIPIFTLNDAEYKIGIWENRPGEAGSKLLCDGRYCKKSIWNVYQPETYKLNERLTGVRNIYFTADDKYHFKGFSFKAPVKAYETLYLAQRSRIYGDTYTVDGDAVTHIGNNVTIEFDGMDFGERPACRLIICGRSLLENNSIHLKFDGDEGVKTELLEFAGSDEYIERAYTISGARGVNTVGFVFLPGCDFDFKYFRFE